MNDMPDTEGDALNESRDSRLFLVANVVDDQPRTALAPGTTIGQAFALIERAGMSHAPVVLKGRVLGIFSSRSVSQCFAFHPNGQDPRDAEIDDYLLPADFVRPSQPLSVAMDLIASQGLALVGDEERLLGMITAEQLRLYLWKIAQPFSLIHDIEMATRQLTLGCLRDEETLDDALVNCDMNRLRGKQVDELTLGQVVRLVTHDDNASYFSPGFGKNLSLAKSKMTSTVQVRNRAFHFSSEIDDEDLATLADTKIWLDRRLSLLGHLTLGLS